MDPDYSKAALLRFLGFVEEKGLLTKQNAQNWRVATGKILEDLSPAEQADVRKIDIETAFKRFANRTAGKFSPGTLGEYRRRATLAIQNFIDYVDDPEAFKPKGPAGKGEKKPARQSNARPNHWPTQGGADPRRTTPEDLPAPASGLAMPYPLRSDFLAQVILPRDLTVDEARRLSAFIMTLAQDYQPTK